MKLLCGKAKSLWYLSGTSRTGEYTRVLYPGGYEFNGEGTELYEAQIPPLLRMFHIKEMSPSGWIAMPKNEDNECINRRPRRALTNLPSTTRHIMPQPEKETVVPYKICSFDIEASSSHGDFPFTQEEL